MLTKGSTGGDHGRFWSSLSFISKLQSEWSLYASESVCEFGFLFWLQEEDALISFFSFFAKPQFSVCSYLEEISNV